MAPHVFWITGLSGAGKSTIAGKLRDYLSDMGVVTVVLDGDDVRDAFDLKFGHDRESRHQSAWFYGKLCRFLVLQGVSVICPTISMFHDVQSWNRKNIPGYLEVFLDVPIDVLKQRDPKGIYKIFEAGTLTDVMGMDIEPEFPRQPDLKISIEAGNSVEETLQELLSYIETIDLN